MWRSTGGNPMKEISLKWSVNKKVEISVKLEFNI